MSTQGECGIDTTLEGVTTPRTGVIHVLYEQTVKAHMCLREGECRVDTVREGERHPGIGPQLQPESKT